VTEARALAAAVIAGAAVRVWQAARTACINPDGVDYIEAARHFHHGEWTAGLASFYPPGYPLAIAAAYPLAGDWEAAGTAVSLVASLLTFAPLAGLLRLCRVPPAAFAAALAGFALSPYPARFAAMVRSEALYGLLLATAVWAVARHLAGGRRALLAAGGAAIGLAYLVRPEGLGLAAAACAALVLGAREAGRSRGAALASCALVLVATLAVAAPYAAYLRADTGRWLLSRKAANVVSLGIQTATGEGTVIAPGESDRAPLARVLAERRGALAEKLLVDAPLTFVVFADCLYWAYVPFLLIGIAVARRRHPRPLDRLLHLGVWLYVAIFALVFVNRRFYAGLVPFALVWCGTGYAWLRERLAERGGRRLAIALAALALAAILPKAVRVPSTDAHPRLLGEEIARRAAGEPRVAARANQVAFYAGGRREDAAFPIDRERLAAWLADGPVWLVVREVDLTPEAHALLAASPAATLVATVPTKEGAPARLYRIDAPRPAAPTGAP
jgi:hypothetical protein